MIYLAQPGDRALADAKHGKRVRRLCEKVENLFNEREVCWFDPIKPYGNPISDCTAVYRTNEAALQIAKGVLAVLPFDVPSIGVPMEIASAVAASKPVAVIGGANSLQLRGLGNQTKKLRMFEESEIEMAIGWLLKQLTPLEEALDFPTRAIGNPVVMTNRIVGNHMVPGDEPESGIRIGSVPELKWTGARRCAPVRSYADDAGWDLVVYKDCVVDPGDFLDIDMGIQIELPPHTWGMITGRSSTLKNRGLAVSQNIIDNGYRGDIFAGVRNVTNHEVRVLEGERIAQIVPIPMMRTIATQVDYLTDSERGLRSFGSTGR